MNSHLWFADASLDDEASPSPEEGIEMAHDEREIPLIDFQYNPEPTVDRNHAEDTFGILTEPKPTTLNSTCTLLDLDPVPHMGSHNTQTFDNPRTSEVTEAWSTSWRDPNFNGVSGSSCSSDPTDPHAYLHCSPPTASGINRVSRFASPLSYSGCAPSPPTHPFAEFQQQESHLKRECTGYEGRHTVCPHLRFSYADVATWATGGLGNGEGYHEQCMELLCHFNDAQIRYRGLGRHGDEITITWGAYPEIIGTRSHGSLEEQFLYACLEKLSDIHTGCPGAFCPHIQKSFDECVNRKGMVRDFVSQSSDVVYHIHCPEFSCAATIAFNLPKTGVTPLGHGSVSFSDRIRILPGKEASDDDWIWTHNPNRYYPFGGEQFARCEHQLDEILPDVAALFEEISDYEEILVSILSMVQDSNTPEIEDILPHIASLFEERRKRSWQSQW